MLGFLSCRHRRVGERERAERERAIITAARDLALAEGWDAVTTRRLAAEIEYSQPVLYSHFKGKDAIMAAVAVEGFAELATALVSAGPPPPTPAGGRRRGSRVRRVRRAASRTLRRDVHPRRGPAVRHSGRANRPGRGFAELSETVRPVAADDDLGTITETFWAGLHGLVTLMRSGRLRHADHDRRLAILVGRFSP
ncbi:helix-turn-helix domain-containing protein [Micromonospora sp. M12]